MSINTQTASSFVSLATDELGRVHGGISDGDAAKVKKLAAAYCEKTAKANANLDYKTLTKASAGGLADQCLAEMALDKSEDGVAAYGLAKSKIKTEFGKYFP